MEEYDVIILGSGYGGASAAVRLIELGKKVAIIEYREVGGTCLNRGCIPTKTLLASAKVFSHSKASHEFGITIQDIGYDLDIIRQRKDDIVKTIRDRMTALLRSKKIVMKQGRGKLIDKNTVEIIGDSGEEQIKGEHIIIATGSEPAIFPQFSIDKKNVLTSDEALDIEKIPSNILIIGSGAIGIEFAIFFSAFGSEVTVVEMLDQVLPILKDKKFTTFLQKSLEKRGIRILTSVKVESIDVESEGKVRSLLSNGDTLENEMVLVSIGRKLNSEGIGLEDVGVLTEGARIIVNDGMQTNVPNIYAIGDVIGGLQLAHEARHEGFVAAESIVGMESSIDRSQVPWVIFSEPEVASCGLTESEAKEAGIDVIKGEYLMMANSNAMARGETEGRIKLVANKDTLEIIGGQIMGPQASVMISEIALAITNKIKITQLAQTVHPHPTLSEVIVAASESALGLKRP